MKVSFFMEHIKSLYKNTPYEFEELDKITFTEDHNRKFYVSEFLM